MGRNVKLWRGGRRYKEGGEERMCMWRCGSRAGRSVGMEMGSSGNTFKANKITP